MELVKIDIVGAQHAQTLVEIGFGSLAVALEGLGGKNHLVANTFEGPADLLLAVQVQIGSVVKSDSPFIRLSKHEDGFIHGKAYDGDGPKSDLGDLKTCSAEYTMAHATFSFLGGCPRIQGLGVLVGAA
jgi:hypothetical protein